MADFTIKEGDLLPELNAVLRDAAGPVDLTAASSVRFHMRTPGSAGSGKVEATASFVDRAEGEVKYTWAGTDTDTAGEYYGEFEVTWPGPKKQTFPNDSQLRIVVTTDLG